MTLLHRIGAFAAVLPLTACSLINSFDEVLEEPSGTGPDSGTQLDSGGTGGGGAGGNTSDASATGGSSGATSDSGAGGMGGADASTGGTAGDAGSSGGAGGGGAGGTGGMPGDAGADAFVPGGPGGALVSFNNGKLWVIDPETGDELSSETIGTVSTIAHDPLTDLWYIFEQQDMPVAPHRLSVRELSTVTGAWREIGTAIVPLPAPGLQAKAVNGRIAYLSGPTAGGLTVLDTTDPTSPRPLDADPMTPAPEPFMLPDGDKRGLLAHVDRSDTGGNVNVVIKASTCPSEACDVSLLRYSLTPIGVQRGSEGLTPVAQVNVTGGSIGFAEDRLSRADVLVIPPLTTPGDGGMMGCAGPEDPTDKAQIKRLDPITHLERDTVEFDVAANRIQSMAVSQCAEIVFPATLFLDPAIWAIPMATGGTVEKQCSAVGGEVFYDPYTNSLFRKTSELEAWDIQGTASEPKLTRRSLGTPADFQASEVGAPVQFRQPIPPPCN